MEDRYMNLSLREKLDIIDAWFLEYNGGELADVLSIVRGPDTQNPHDKARYTNALRKAAFPRTWQSALVYTYHGFSRWGVTHTEVYSSDDLVEKNADYSINHFESHILRAANVLGLK
jgi:hypothetical protein